MFFLSFSRPRHYCVVESPVVRNDRGQVEFDENGQAKLVHADLDIRLSQADQAPFPLYPGEILRQVRSTKGQLSTLNMKIFFSLSHR